MTALEYQNAEKEVARLNKIIEDIKAGVLYADKTNWDKFLLSAGASNTVKELKLKMAEFEKTMVKNNVEEVVEVVDDSAVTGELSKNKKMLLVFVAISIVIAIFIFSAKKTKVA